MKRVLVRLMLALSFVGMFGVSTPASAQWGYYRQPVIEYRSVWVPIYQLSECRTRYILVGWQLQTVQIVHY